MKSTFWMTAQETEEELKRREIILPKNEPKHQPCPICGSDDRFAHKWHCTLERK